MVLLLFFTASLSHAQSTAPSVAPDFEVTDIYGQNHHLYEYLDQGKTVILQFGTTWCTSCWLDLKTGTLNDVHTLLGPDGLDNTVLLLFESEPTNTLDQIYGIVGETGNTIADFTFGDWRTLVDYPIIDSHEVALDYGINKVPTLLKVCPSDRTYTEIPQNQSLDAYVASILQSQCMPPAHTHDLALLNIDSVEYVCENEPMFFDIDVVNVGQTTINTAQIRLTNHQGELLASHSLTNPLGTYTVHTVRVGPVIFDSPQTLFIEAISDGDKHPHNNICTRTAALSLNAQTTELELTLQTDNYGFETFWAIVDAHENIVASGGNTEVGLEHGGFPYLNAPYGDGAYGNGQLYTEYISLPSEGCYRFVMVDDYGDGICCTYGFGQFVLQDVLGNVLVEGSSFGDYFVQHFNVHGYATASEEMSATPNISCFPNPAKDYIQIYIAADMPPEQPVVLHIFNTLMQKVGTYALVTTQNTLDLSSLPSGSYTFVFTKSQQCVHTQRVQFF